MVVLRQAVQSELSQVIPAACGFVWQHIKANGVPGGEMTALYLDCVMHVEVGAIIHTDARDAATGLRPAQADDTIFYSELPAGEVVMVSHWGNYSGITAAHMALQEWCAANAVATTGITWEIYGHWSDDESKLRTDIVYQLAEQK